MADKFLDCFVVRHNLWRTPRNDKGFTLIEVLLVTVILLIIAAVSAPNFSPFLQKLELKQAANDLANLARYAQSRAIVTNKMVRINFSSHNDEYWLEEEKEPADEEEPVKQEIDEKEEKVFERVSGRYGKKTIFSPRVVFKSEHKYLDFWPDGRIEKKDFELCNERQCFVVTTKGFRGKVNVIETEL